MAINVADKPAVGNERNLLELLDTRVKESTGPAAQTKLNGQWTEVSWESLRERVKALSDALVGWGVKPGDRVAIFASTSLQWLVCDLAISRRPRHLRADLRLQHPRRGALHPPELGRGALLRRRRRARRQAARPPHPAQGQAGRVARLPRGGALRGRRCRRAAARRAAGEGQGRGRLRGAGQAGERGRPLPLHLHLGHHRRPEGRDAHPRQLGLRGEDHPAGGHDGGGRLGDALPPARPQLRPGDQGGLAGHGLQAGDRRVDRQAAAEPGRDQADHLALGAAGVREGVQLGLLDRGVGAGHARLARALGVSPLRRVGRREGGRPPLRVARLGAGQAAGVLQGEGGGEREAGRAHAPVHLGRRAALAQDRLLLRAARLRDPRGLRADRDLGRLGGEPARADEDRHGGQAGARHRGEDRRGRRDSAQGPRGDEGLLEAGGRHGGGAAARRLVPHRRHRRARRAGLPQASPTARRTSSSPRAGRTWRPRTWRTRSRPTR